MNRDLGVTELVRSLLPESSVPLFELVALLGDELVVVGVLAALAVSDAFRSLEHGDDGPLSDRTGFVLAVVLAGLAFTLALKVTLDAPRPPESLQAVSRSGNGFPSGHTLAATLCWGALARWWRRGSLRLRAIGASVAVAAVAVSRLALGVHFFVDVVVSVAVGLAFLFLVARFTHRDPAVAFGLAAVLGVVTVVVTGGGTDGWLAFGGCVGGAVGWWALSRPAVRRGWQSVARSQE